jgi:hypothetical protein
VITPTTTQFRVVIIVALICWSAMAVLPNIGAIPFSEDVANARQWNYFGSTISFWVIQVWWVVSGLLTLCGLLGMLRFWPPSRWMLAIGLFASLVMQPLLGLAVYSPFEASLGSISSASFLWLVCVSFYSPLSAHFTQSNSVGGRRQ